MRLKKDYFAYLISLFIIVLSLFAIIQDSYAGEIVASGTWKSNISWKVDSEGTLTISGSGKMADGKSEDYLYPWREEFYTIRKLVVKNGVTSIASRAFSDLEDLSQASFPDSLNEIGDAAFYNCGFEYVAITKNVNSIGSSPFCKCKKLKFIDVSSENKNYKTVDGVLYSKDGYSLIQYPNAKEGDYSILPGTQYIGRYAFEDSKITGIGLPESIRVIRYGAFSECGGLKDVRLPEGLVWIEEYGFDKCANLEYLVFPASLKYVGDYAFAGDGTVIAVSCKASQEQRSDIFIGKDNERLYFPKALTEDPFEAGNRAGFTSLKWLSVGNSDFWYEEGIRQGTAKDTKGVKNESGDVRGREIYDPESDSWYWLDSVINGAKAKSKEVWMPYVYNDEENMTDEELAALAERSGSLSGQILSAMKSHGFDGKCGKWVRYDSLGKMIKGWYTVEGAEANLYPSEAGNKYYYDPITGSMAKGLTTIDGCTYHFDEVTGALWK